VKVEYSYLSGPPILGCGTSAAVGMRVRHWMVSSVTATIVGLSGDGLTVCVRVDGESTGPRWTYSGIWEVIHE
jgi:hypothetical protein